MIARAGTPVVQFVAVTNDPAVESREIAYESPGVTQVLRILPKPIISDAEIESAEIAAGQPNVINIMISEKGARMFRQQIKDMLGERVAILVDGKVLSAPVLQTVDFGQKLQINGNFREGEAQDIADRLNKK